MLLALALYASTAHARRESPLVPEWLCAAMGPRSRVRSPSAS